MKQLAIIFSMNPARYDQVSIDTQINNFLKDHADHKVSSISYSGIGSLEKALVIFDVGKPFDGNRQNNNFNQKKSS